MQSNTIIGYTATNTVRATTSDLTQVGPLIDTANQAGAGSVGNLSFTLQNPDSYQQQALSAAAKQAQAYASAIATGLGSKTGAVVSAQQGASTSYPILAGGVASSVPTPVQTGMVTVAATVTITVQLLQ